MSGRTPQPVRLVDDEEVDAGLDGAPRQLGARDERLERDHRARVGFEGVEAGAEVAHDIGEPRLVEQHEYLVVLAPQLAEPLDRERLGGDDQAALGAPRAHEAAQHQAGLDRLAEADLVGEQPAHGVAPRRALGRVKLVGEEPDPSAQERAEAVRLAERREVERVQAEREVLDGVEPRGGEPRHEVGARVERLRVFWADLVQRGRLRREAQRRAGLERHAERAALDRHHPSGAELRVVLVTQPVAGPPRDHVRILGGLFR